MKYDKEILDKLRNTEMILICSKCEKVYKVKTSCPKIYTDKIKKIWKCLGCSNKK